MSEYDIKGRIVYTDEGATVTLDKTTKALDEHGKAAAKGAEASRTATEKAAQMASAFGVAGQAASRLSPAMGQLTTMTGGALSMVQSLTTAGMGPLGIAVAGVSLAITAGSAIMSAFEGDTRTAGEEVNILRTAIADAASAFDELTASQARQRIERQRGAQLALGQATEAQAQVEITRLEGEIDAQRITNFRGENDRQIRQLEDRLQMVSEGAAAAHAAAVADAATAEQALAAGHGGKDAESPGAARGRGGAARGAAAGGVDDAARAREEASAAALARLIEDMDAEAEVRRMMRAEEAAESQAAVDQAIDDEERRVIGVRRQIDREIAAREKAAKTNDQILSTTAQAHTLLASVIEASAGSSEKSEKAKTQALAAASMVSSGIEMAVEIARIAQSYPDPVGMATHAIGAANFAVAIGVAAAAAGGGGAAAPSGGGGMPATSSPGGGPSAPAQTGEPGGNTYNVYVGGSGGGVFVADRNELMRTLGDGIRAADARRGR